MRTIVVVIVGVLSVIYLFNPTAGIFELIPDNIPFIGNLDEAGAVALLIAVLGYFGYDVSDLFKRKETKKEKIIENVEIEEEK